MDFAMMTDDEKIATLLKLDSPNRVVAMAMIEHGVADRFVEGLDYAKATVDELFTAAHCLRIATGPGAEDGVIDVMEKRRLI